MRKQGVLIACGLLVLSLRPAAAQSEPAAPAAPQYDLFRSGLEYHQHVTAHTVFVATERLRQFGAASSTTTFKQAPEARTYACR
jgi:hypothetical protein